MSDRPMVRVYSGFDFTSDQSVGDFTWAFNEHEGGQRYILIRLPDSNAPVTTLPVLRVGEAQPVAKHAYWQWDGNEDTPTLTPSILHHSEPPWHGFVTAGKLVNA